jgi:hypothetical protein
VAVASTRSAGSVGGDKVKGSECWTLFAGGRTSYRSESGNGRGLLKQTSPAVREKRASSFLP